MTAEAVRPHRPPLGMRSPLDAWRGRFAALPDGLEVDADVALHQLSLRLPADGPARAAAEAVLANALPSTASTWTEVRGGTASWLGPQEWLLLFAPGEPAPVITLRSALAGTGGTVVDVSAQRITLRLTGRHVPDLLAGGCAVDLHPSVFGRGSAIATTIAQIGVILLGQDAGATDVALIVRSSFAGALADWILDAATEYAETLPLRNPS